MSRKPKHTPESRAREITDAIRNHVPSLTFRELAAIEGEIAVWMEEIMPTRTRKPKALPISTSGVKP